MSRCHEAHGKVGVVGKLWFLYMYTESYLSRSGLRDWLCSCQSWMQPAGGREHFSCHVAHCLLSQLSEPVALQYSFDFLKGKNICRSAWTAKMDRKKACSIDSSVEGVTECGNHVGKEKDINSFWEITMWNNCTAASGRSICHIFTLSEAFKKHLGKKKFRNLIHNMERKKQKHGGIQQPYGWTFTQNFHLIWCNNA